MSTDTRAELKSAIQKASTLEGHVKRLESAVDRAQEAIEDAEAEFRRYANLDAEITRWRVSQVKNGASTKILPKKLKARTEAKRAAADELEQSRETLRAISDELERARLDFKEAEDARISKAVEVVSAMGDSLAKELIEISQRRLVILQILYGLRGAEFKRGCVIGWTDLTARAMEQNSEIGYAQITHGLGFEKIAHLVNPLDGMGERWRERLDAIVADPAAEITIPRPLTPEDYIPEPPRRWEDGQLISTGTDGWRPEQEQPALEATARG